MCWACRSAATTRLASNTTGSSACKLATSPACPPVRPPSQQADRGRSRHDTTHKHSRSRHGWNTIRGVCHFTPKSKTWVNAVENFFSVLTASASTRAVFRWLVDLQAAIHRYLMISQHPKPFVWTVSAASILARLDRLPAINQNTRARSDRSDSKVLPPTRHCVIHHACWEEASLHDPSPV
jgi:hypothetical protein